MTEEERKTSDDFLRMQREYYTRIADTLRDGNEAHNNDNPDYWDILLKPVKASPARWDQKAALDYGSGGGRNIINLLKLANFRRVDGCDIVQEVLNGARTNVTAAGISLERSSLHLVSGRDLKNITSETYDFVMSCVVLQHISVYEVRLNILDEINRVMKPGAIFSFQMILDEPDFLIHHQRVGYFEERTEATGTNGEFDVNLEDPEYMVDDLTMLGFRNIRYEKRPAPTHDFHQYWVYFTCEK